MKEPKTMTTIYLPVALKQQARIQNIKDGVTFTAYLESLIKNDLKNKEGK